MLFFRISSLYSYPTGIHCTSRLFCRLFPPAARALAGRLPHKGCGWGAQRGVQRLCGTLPETLGCVLAAGIARRAPSVPVLRSALVPLATVAQGQKGGGMTGMWGGQRSSLLDLTDRSVG